MSSEEYIQTSKTLHEFQDKCIVIPHGIGIERFDVDLTVTGKINEYKRKYGDRIVLCVGRLRYYKGLEYLIRAMIPLDATLVLVGKGKEERHYKALCKELRIEEKVRFLGYVPHEDLPAMYHASRVVVLPSVYRSEAFGIVLLEAMACGKPVISTEIGTATSWVNQDGVTGLVVPPRDVNGLSAAIAEILGNVARTRTMGDNGRKRVETVFSRKVMGQKILEVYRQALA